MSQRKPRTRRVTPGNHAIVVGYVRASTDRQDISPHRQCEAMQRWAATAGVELVAVYLDRDVCGETPTDERPGFTAMLAAVRELGAGAVVVSSRDRLGRDPVACALAERSTAAVGARVVAATGVGNGDTPIDTLVRHMADGFAAFELATIRQRIRDSLASLKQRGRRTGGVPYGYRAGDRVGRDGVELVRDEEEQRTIARAVEVHASGLSLRAISATLAREGRVSRAGAPFVPCAVSKMIASASRDDLATAAE